MKRKYWLAVITVMILAACSFAFAACGKTEEPGATTYTVTFAGEGIETVTAQVEKGGKAVKPTDPVREGFKFLGWFDGDAPYDFDTAVNADLTLTVRWENTDATIGGGGTVSQPYTIGNKYALKAFADGVNAGNSPYAAKGVYVELTSDIDLAGESWTPVGKLTDAGEESIVFDKVFKGFFDGKGHTIKNVTIETTVTDSSDYTGFFAITYMAEIRNLTLDTLAVTVNAPGTLAYAYIAGGLVGYANMSNIKYCAVRGVINVTTNKENAIYTGGLAGSLSSGLVDGVRGVTYCEYNSAEVNIISDDKGGVAGGLLGAATTASGAVVVANCYATGTVSGGIIAGGLVGNADSYASIVNCYATGNVTGQSPLASYAGGLVGSLGTDALVLDCYASGNVTAPAATEAMYESYAGAVVGYKSEAYIDDTFVQGSAVVNSYYKEDAIITCPDRKSEEGTAVARADAAFYKDTLKWTEEDWDLTGIPMLKAESGKTITEYTLTMRFGTDTKAIVREKGAVVGNLESAPAAAPKLFFDWFYEDTFDNQYRFYMPLYKDTTVYALLTDTTEIAGTYKHTNTYNDTVATFEFYTSGKMAWFSNAGISSGNYTYDGYYLYVSTNTPIGDFVIDAADGTFRIYYGDTLVNYTMTKYDPDILGVYFSDDNATLVFAGTGDMYLDYKGSEYSGTYKKNGDTITVTKLGAFKGTITFAGETLEVNLSSTMNTISGTFRKGVSSDHTGAAYLGVYKTYWVTTSSSGEQLTVTPESLVLQADGIAYLGATECLFYYVPSTNMIKLNYMGYFSSLVYDENEDTLVGGLNKGVTKYCVLSRGELLACYGTTDAKTLLMMTTEGNYFISAGANVAFTLTGTPADNAIIEITADGKTVKYIIDGNLLRVLGAEYGAYTENGNTYTLDGKGGLTGTKQGTYYVYGDKVVMHFADGTFASFDYVQAAAADNVCVLIPDDGFGGIYYRYVNGEAKNKLIVDGFGHSFYLYMSDDGWKNNYTPATYSVVNAITVSASFNYTASVMTYLYDKNVVRFVRGTADELFIREEYTGSTELPALPADYVRTWAGTVASAAAELTISADGAGTYNGAAFTGSYDGLAFYFSVGATAYKATVAGGTLTLSVNGGDYALTEKTGGGDTEVIPAAFVGTWEGKVGANMTTFIINSDGTGSYNGDPVPLTLAAETITAKFGNFIISAKLKDNKLSVTFEDTMDELTLSGDLTKKSEDVVPAAFVGTWEGKAAFSVAVTVVITSDGTVTYNGDSVTPTITATKITFVMNSEEYSLTLVENKLVLNYTFDSSDYGPYDLTKA